MARKWQIEEHMVDQSAYSKPEILIVTEEPSTAEAAAQLASECNYSVATVANGAEALAVLKQRSIDLLLADINVSHISGIQMTQAATRMFPDLAIVLMTPFGGMEAARTALNCGASDFVVKPLDLPQLVMVLERNLERKRLDARELSENRDQVLFSAIKALAAAIDAKSRFTATHSSRVTSLCLSVGKLIHLEPTEMATLELAAQIHDIGKIGTPDEVLDKPGTLTDLEWVDILRHPDIGSSILLHVPALCQVASIIRHHHERYDGAGYPDGLSGSAIPLLSRIVAIADAYEAMTADRPYRIAKSHSEAIRELRANVRTQFDPTLLEYFVAAIDDMEAGKRAA